MWEKIVANLISNALKFTHTGEIAVRIREEASGFALEVADSGVGIPESELPRIFDRFYRVAGVSGRTYEGTGIGLSLVRELIELHGGQVTVESVIGRGTTFRVEIPKGFSHLPANSVSHHRVDSRLSRDLTASVAEAARWVAPSTAERPLPGGSKAETSPQARIMLVDDNADFRAYLFGLLSPVYDVKVAGDGLAALEEIRAWPPDIVVSDVMMPRLDGLGLVRELRAEIPLRPFCR